MENNEPNKLNPKLWDEYLHKHYSEQDIKRIKEVEQMKEVEQSKHQCPDKAPNTLVFGIDCDEVLRATLETMVSLYNKEFNDHKTIDDVKDFVVENSFPRIYELSGKTAGEWFFQDHSEELFRNTDAIPGIVEAINILKKYGKVVVITYQKSYKNKIDTLNWLEEHGVEPDGICFLKDKTVLHCDYLIDDNDWNFIGSNAVHGILIDAPYNKDKDVDELLAQSNCKVITRFHSLLDFAKELDCQATKDGPADWWF